MISFNKLTNAYLIVEINITFYRLILYIPANWLIYYYVLLVKNSLSCYKK